MSDDASGLLLETKLYVPRSKRGLVLRPQLSERLDVGSGSKLTLVSAPAGFGKSTLLAEWLTAGPAAPADQRSGAWLSLDRGDNHPVSFWTYLIAALRTVEPRVGERALALLQAAPPPIETALTTLINDLGAIERDLVLVLDDYHVIEAREVQESMAFLLDHMPARLHLVIAGRADPSLPLARLRARGELVEIRAAELRFTPEEAAQYLNGVMGLELTAADVAALEGRTEGWIAALQLAALSMRGRDDVTGFIAGFAGDDRYVVDYLLEEVLQRQPEQIQAFLLQTSILTRLSGPLCDAVTGQSGGRARLEALDRENLFLVPLDDRRRWYRYHHLFADVLQARLLDEQPGSVAGLHRRASEWYAQNGERAVAITHALAGEDFERAADLIELAFPGMRVSRQEARVLGWLAAIPEALLRVRPVLSVNYAGALLASGELEGVETRLRYAERWLDPAPEGRGTAESPRAAMVVLNGDEFQGLPAAIAVYRAAQSLARGDVAGTMTHAGQARELLRDDDHLLRGAAAGLLGLAYWTPGDLESAHRMYSECMASLRRAGHIADVLGVAIGLADIRIGQGRPREAMRTYEQALQLAAAQDGPVLRGTPDLHVGMSELQRERNDLPAARRHLRASQDLGEHAGLPQNAYRSCVAWARIREAEGDRDGAVALLDEAERRYVGDFFPYVRPVPAVRARVWIVQGRLDDALGWAREQGLTADDELSYLREFEHLTLARALLAGNQRAVGVVQETVEFLERLLAAAEAGGRAGSVIEILVLLALAHQVRGDVPAALVSLERALALAEPEGYIRKFVDEGSFMLPLLAAAAERAIAANYVRRLLDAFDHTGDGKPSPEVSSPFPAVSSSASSKVLIEPLSGRELDVLRLLATDLGGPEIARELVVSLNTVRTHTKNIYAKLGVNNRRAAVRQAQELGLLRSRS